MAWTGQLAPPIVEDAVALSLLRWGSDTRAARLLKDLVREEAANGVPPAGLLRRLALRLGCAESVLARAKGDAARAMEVAAAGGLTVVPWLDAAYPTWLKEIPDPPIVLWVRGQVADLNQPAVAIVGFS